LFINKKPRIIGYNNEYGFTRQMKKVLGKERIAEFMVYIVFPVIVKREHFKLIREHIKNQMNVSSFEEAFKKICTENGSDGYSQIDYIIHYLWHFKHDQYEWFIKDVKNHPYLKQKLTNDPKILSMNRPINAVMKVGRHWNYDQSSFHIIYDYVCLASLMKAGDCHKYQNEEIQESVIKNFFVDWTVRTASWAQRKMPAEIPEIVEEPWSIEGLSYKEVYVSHLRKIKNRNFRSDWKSTFGTF